MLCLLNRAPHCSPPSLSHQPSSPRVLYGNKITDLPKGVFGGLFALQLL